MKVKVESEKVGLKLNIQKTKIMASGPITSWEIDGETMEIVADFILGGSKITADGDCSHEIERYLYSLNDLFCLFGFFKTRCPSIHVRLIEFWNMIWLNMGEGNGNPLQYSCLENPMD